MDNTENNNVDHFLSGISKMGMDAEGFVFMMLSKNIKQVEESFGDFHLSEEEKEAIKERIVNFGN